jgi:hypothetical protein
MTINHDLGPQTIPSPVGFLN